jgi:hypothetical protein
MRSLPLLVALASGLLLQWGGMALLKSRTAVEQIAYSGFTAPRVIQDNFPPFLVESFPAIILYIITLLGICAHIVWTYNQKTWKGVGWGVVKPFVVSPIVFSVIYAIAKDVPDGIAGATLAFQNGFFWNVIVGERPK